MADKILTQELLHELFEYRDGELFWKIKKSSSCNIGDKAGSINSSGYLLIGIQRKLYLAHRLVFLMHHGYLPKQIDHIDRNKLNNKIDNLRESNQSENCYNTKVRSDNLIGIKGVTWREDMKKWCVQVSVERKNKVIGYFEDLDLAKLVAIEARDKYHGIFANHG